MIEGQTQSMRLVDVEVPISGLLVQWIYHSQISKREVADAISTSEYNHAARLLPLFKLWVISDRFLMPKLRSHAFDAMREALGSSGSVPLDFIKLVYDSDDISDLEKLKKLVDDTMAFSTIEEALKSIPKDLLEELRTAVMLRLKDTYQAGQKILRLPGKSSSKAKQDREKAIAKLSNEATFIYHVLEQKVNIFPDGMNLEFLTDSSYCQNSSKVLGYIKELLARGLCHTTVDDQTWSWTPI